MKTWWRHTETFPKEINLKCFVRSSKNKPVNLPDDGAVVACMIHNHRDELTLSWVGASWPDGWVCEFLFGWSSNHAPPKRKWCPQSQI